MFRNVERVDGEPTTKIVRLLSRRIKGETTGGRIVFAQIRTRLDRVRGKPIAFEPHLHDSRGFFHGGFCFQPVATFDFKYNICAEALVHDGRVSLDCRPQAGYGRKRLVIDGDCLGTIFGRPSALSHNGGDNIADVMNLRLSKRRARHLVHGPAIAEGHWVHNLELAKSRVDPIGCCEN